MPLRSKIPTRGHRLYANLDLITLIRETSMATTVRPTASTRKSTSTDVQRVLELIKEKKVSVVDV
jgi:hypothetical protein